MTGRLYETQPQDTVHIAISAIKSYLAFIAFTAFIAL